MSEKLKEQDKNRNYDYLKPWQFKPGQSGNPKGRPPGKSLKERARAMLNAMSEEEEQEFLKGIDKKTIWEMAEGKPKQDTDITSKGEQVATITGIVVHKPDDNSNGKKT